MKLKTVLKNLRIAKKELNHAQRGAYFEKEKIVRGIEKAIEFLEEIEE